MHVFVTGATGVLGRRFVDRLVDRGHSVIGLVRDEAGKSVVERAGGRPRRGDVLDQVSLERIFDSHVIDIVVHAATSLPTGPKPSSEDWTRNDRVRLDGTRNLVAAAESVERFVFPGVVWVARQPDGSAFDEESTRHPDRTTRSAVAVEDFLADAASEHGFDVTILRYGILYAPDAAHTREFGRNLLSGRLPAIGGGLLGRRDAELAMIHADDAARALVAALDADADGVYHVIDDELVTIATLLGELADRLGAPSPRRLPGWLVKFFLGDETVTLLTEPMPTTNERFRREVGWKPRYPTYREGLEQVVETWADEGTLRRTGDGFEWVGDDRPTR